LDLCLRSRRNLIQRPSRVFGDEWFCIARGSLQGRQRSSIANISQGHANITQKAATFRSQYRSAGKSGFETGGIKPEQVEQVRLV
jgi:hypothetical protein